MTTTKLDAEHVKQRADLVKLIQHRGIDLKAAGDGFIGLCPFHDDRNNPSLSVSSEKGVFNCFACSARGDVFEFVQKLDNVDFPTALRTVADFAGVTPAATNVHRNGSTNGTAKPSRNGASAAAKPGPIVASYRYTDESGELLFEVCRHEPKTFRQRRPDADAPGGWSWKLGDVRRPLYRLPQVLAAEEVYVCEGEKDVEALVGLDLCATTNAGGAAQKWRAEWTEALAGKRVVVLPDNDGPGLKRCETIVRELKGSVAELLAVRVPSPYKDVSDFLADGHTRDDLEELVAEARKQLRTEELAAKGLLCPREILELTGGLGPLMKPPRGLQTGFHDFDRLTLGLHAGELSIIAARPAQGKTSLALNIALKVALSGRSVAIFSLEMSRSSLLVRLFCSEANVSMMRMRQAVLDREERRRINGALNAIADLRLMIDDSNVDISTLTKRLERMESDGPVHLVIVDYLQLLAGRRTENRTQQVAEMSRAFKLMARRFNCPFLVLSQLSRATETRTNPRPQLSDLRDSGSIEQDADLVSFVFREEMYRPDKPELRGKAELIIAKQRNGPTGVAHLRFDPQFMRFSDEGNTARRGWSREGADR